MTRALVFLGAAASLVLDTSTALAHHSHPYFYDQCQAVSIVGRVERVDWKNPHTIVVVRQDDGATFTIDWNSLTALKRDAVLDSAKEALVFGVRVEVAGNPIRPVEQIRQHFPDFAGNVNPRTIDPRSIRRADDSWKWTMGQKPDARPADCSGR